jgi:hypothetical protein
MTRILAAIEILFISLLLTGCFKEDEMVTPHPRGDVMTDTISMTQNYRYQVYFKLDSGIVAARLPRTLTDLGFECAPGGWKIILNTADFMEVADLGVVPFGVAQDTASRFWTFDKSDGNPDSLAFGRWFEVDGADTVSANHVYVVNRGIDEEGNLLGYVQVIFDSLTNGTYHFRWAPLAGGQVTSASVSSDPSTTYAWYSFSGGGATVVAEPPAAGFDLLFTQYTTLLFTDLGEAYPYLVTGVLLNRSGVEAAIDTVHEFADITLETAQSLSFSSALDRIGYEWKYYDFESGAYTVRTGISYCIRDTSGFLYKLRFIGFYNSMGDKGYPVIEYQRL